MMIKWSTNDQKKKKKSHLCFSLCAKALYVWIHFSQPLYQVALLVSVHADETEG